MIPRWLVAFIVVDLVIVAAVLASGAAEIDFAVPLKSVIVLAIVGALALTSHVRRQRG